MVLLWSIFISLGLWLLFPRGFKYMVAAWVSTAGAMFFWGVGVVFWSMAVCSPSWAGMGWSMVLFIVLGNVGGMALAAKG